MALKADFFKCLAPTSKWLKPINFHFEDEFRVYNTVLQTVDMRENTTSIETLQILFESLIKRAMATDLTEP